MTRRLSLVLVLSLNVPGCAYVGQAAFEAKRDSLDEDGDGAPYGGPERDCDDNDARVSPDLDEIPYDGLDNDCSDGDALDVDGDGFPGIAREDYLAQFPEAVWPGDVQPGPVDCADDPDVWPDAVHIHPNQTGDDTYDGIDADCAGDNDFDADGDGYVSDEHRAAFEQYVLDWGLEHLDATARFGDCNDLRAAAHPGVDPSDDPWYDGHDDDCAGNNDFDADADGWMWDEATHAVAYSDFVELYHPGGAPWVEQWGDCLDQANPAAIVPVDAASVFPTNPADVPYDGIDSDCDCGNDFDADADGVMPDAALDGAFGSTFDDYELDWGCGLTPAYGDCDDSDGESFPGGLERLDDAADGDCNGDPDTTPFGFGSPLWSHPRPPRLVRTDHHYLLVTSAEWSDPDGTNPANASDWLGLALPFEHTAGFDAPVSGTPVLWTGAVVPLPMADFVDAAGYGDALVVATGWEYAPANAYATSKVLDFFPPNGYAVSATEQAHVQSLFHSTSVDLHVDFSGNPWLLICGDDTLQVMRGGGSSGTPLLTTAVTPTPLDPIGAPGGVCFWGEEPVTVGDGGTAQLVACTPGIDCETWDFDADAETLVPAAANPWAGTQLEYGQFREGWHILVHTGQGGAEIDGPDGNAVVLASWTVHAIDAHWRDTDGASGMDELFVAAVAEPIPDDGAGPRVVLSHGPIDGPHAEQVLPFEHPTRPDLVPDGVGIHVDSDRLFVGVSAIDDTPDPADCYPAGSYPNHDYCLSDAVGWVFFGG